MCVFQSRLAVDLVDEEEFAFLQVGEDGRQIALLLQSRCLDDLAGSAHLVGQDVREGGLAEARWAEEQHMVDHLAPLGGGLQGDLEAGLHLLLADIFLEPLRPQGVFSWVLGAAGGIKVGMSVHGSYSLTGLPLVSSRWTDNLGSRSPTPPSPSTTREVLWPSATSS